MFNDCLENNVEYFYGNYQLHPRMLSHELTTDIQLQK